MKKFKGMVYVGLLSLSPLGATLAEGCIELKSVAQVEEKYTDAQGKPAVRKVPAARVIPGTAIHWTISARNVCPRSVDSVLIDSPISEQMTFVVQSAQPTDTMVVTFTLDGKAYAAAETLTVKEADGTSRPARPDEYRGIRFAMKGALPGNQTAVASYQTTVE